MEKGRIIFLNGVTSAGKTSIVESLQDQEEIFFYVVANDLFQEMVGDNYLRKNYWKYLSEVIIMMYHTAKLYSDMGKHVLIDGILVEREEIRPHYHQLLEILKNNPLDLMEIYCPLDICRQRNLIRRDRYESQSQEQHDLMAENIQYSARVDTSIYITTAIKYRRFYLYKFLSATLSSIAVALATAQSSALQNKNLFRVKFIDI